MPEGTTWVAVLMPARWEEAERTSARALVGHPDSPWLALVDGSGARLAYLTADPGEARARERQSLTQLRARRPRARWEHYDQAHSPLLIRRGDPHTATDVLDPGVLLAAGDRLCAERIAVAIPARDVMLAGTDPAEVQRVCAGLHALAEPEAALSRLVFEVRGGQLTGASGPGTRRTRRHSGESAGARRPTGQSPRPFRTVQRPARLVALGLGLLGLAGLLAAARRWQAAPAPRATVSPAIQVPSDPQPERSQ